MADGKGTGLLIVIYIEFVNSELPYNRNPFLYGCQDIRPDGEVVVVVPFNQVLKELYKRAAR